MLLSEAGDEVTVGAVAITDSHHPQVLDPCEVLLYDIGILVGLFEPRDEALPTFDRECFNN